MKLIKIQNNIIYKNNKKRKGAITMRPYFLKEMERKIITKEDEQLFLFFLLDITIDLILFHIISKAIKKRKLNKKNKNK